MSIEIVDREAVWNVSLINEHWKFYELETMSAVIEDLSTFADCFHIQCEYTTGNLGTVRELVLNTNQIFEAQNKKELMMLLDKICKYKILHGRWQYGKQKR